VNGPGEARHADIAVSGGVGEFILFVRGQKVKTLPAADVSDTIAELVAGWGAGGAADRSQSK